MSGKLRHAGHSRQDFDDFSTACILGSSFVTKSTLSLVGVRFSSTDPEITLRVNSRFAQFTAVVFHRIAALDRSYTRWRIQSTRDNSSRALEWWLNGLIAHEVMQIKETVVGEVERSRVNRVIDYRFRF